MLKYFVSRILLLIPMLLVIGLVVFIGLELAPGDPITAMIPPDQLSSMTLEDIEAMRESLGLNDPMLVRYFRWLFNLIKGDMGYSVVTGTPIASIIQNLLPATIKLTFAALIISTIMFIIWFVSAIKSNTFIDYICRSGVIGILMPEFFIGILAR